MKINRQKLIRFALGISDDIPEGHLKWCTSAISPARRVRFLFQHFLPRLPLPSNIGAYTIGDQDWGPLLSYEDGKISPIEIQPFMRPRDQLDIDLIRLSWSSYHPASLLYHYPTFGGKEAFARTCNLRQTNVPLRIKWDRYIPHTYIKQWVRFLSLINSKDNIVKDEVIEDILSDCSLTVKCFKSQESVLFLNIFRRRIICLMILILGRLLAILSIRD